MCSVVWKRQERLHALNEVYVVSYALGAITFHWSNMQISFGAAALSMFTYT